MEPQGSIASQARLQPDRYRRRILVVEDHEDSREALACFLELQGHSVCTASNGLEGLKAADRFHPEIVFLDLSMPRMDGFEVCARLREREEFKEAAVFALSADYAESSRLKEARGRLDAYLTKPVEFPVIAGLIDSVST